MIPRFTIPSIFIRNIEAEILLENFLVSSVSSILLIRFFLRITGYPQIGGESFHIAHMLFGGFIMLIALILLIAFLSKPLVHASAILGGIGFGTFIDELGKFITRDNDYFFQPTVAIIYIIFVALFLIFRAIEQYSTYSQKEYLINALDLMKEAVMSDLDTDERNRALAYLKKSDQNDPVVKEVLDILSHFTSLPKPKQTLITQIRHFFRSLYHKVIKTRLFTTGIVVILGLNSISTLVFALFYYTVLVEVVLFIISVLALFSIVSRFLNEKRQIFQIINTIILIIILLLSFLLFLRYISLHDIPVHLFGQYVSSIVSSVLTIAGITRIRTSRLDAYRLFKYALLVSITITQVFTFYQVQFLGLMTLSINLFYLSVLEYMISREEREAE